MRERAHGPAFIECNVWSRERTRGSPQRQSSKAIGRAGRALDGRLGGPLVTRERRRRDSEPRHKHEPSAPGVRQHPGSRPPSERAGRAKGPSMPLDRTSSVTARAPNLPMIRSSSPERTTSRPTRLSPMCPSSRFASLFIVTHSLPTDPFRYPGNFRRSHRRSTGPHGSRWRSGRRRRPQSLPRRRLQQPIVHRRRRREDRA